MKEEVKDLWVKALRSGDYQQGRAALNSGGKFCCLGVLCDVLGVPKLADDQNPGDFAYGDAAGMFHGLLPQVAQTLSGVKTQTGLFVDREAEPGNKNQSLVYLNDSGKTFAVIADAIESHWKQL